MGGPCKCDGKTYYSMDNFLICKFIVDDLT